MREIENWYFVGGVERAAMSKRRPSYCWHPAYSLCVDGSIQPWQTRREVLADTKQRGVHARFNGGKVQ